MVVDGIALTTWFPWDFHSVFRCWEHPEIAEPSAVILWCPRSAAVAALQWLRWTKAQWSTQRPDRESGWEGFDGWNAVSFISSNPVFLGSQVCATWIIERLPFMAMKRSQRVPEIECGDLSNPGNKYEFHCVSFIQAFYPFLLVSHLLWHCIEAVPTTWPGSAQAWQPQEIPGIASIFRWNHEVFTTCRRLNWCLLLLFGRPYIQHFQG